MSANSQDRTIEGSYVYFGKAIVRNSRNVVVAPNIFCQGYVKGNGVRYVSPATLHEEIRQKSGVFESKESLFPMIIPVGSDVMSNNWIDIRGTNRETGNKVYHPSAEYYTKVLGIDDTEITSITNDMTDYESTDYSANTITWLGHFEYGPDYSIINLNTGHLGPNTYSQVCSSRKNKNFAPVRAMNYGSKTG